MAKDKIKIPSVLENISDDSKVVLYDLLNFYGYQHIIEKKLKNRLAECHWNALNVSLSLKTLLNCYFINV